MSGNGGRKLVAAVLTGVGLAVGAAHAQTPQELLDRAKQQQQAQVAEAKLEGEVAEVLRTAPGLYKSAPEKAIQNLKAIAVKVTVAAITETKRKELLKQIDDATAAIKGTAPAAEPKTDPALLERILKNEKNQKAVDAAKTEAKEVNEALVGIAKDIDNRKEAEAKKKLADIAAKYPDNPSVILLQHQQMNADDIAMARWLSDETGRRWTKAMNDVQASAMPPLGDIEYPKDFIEKGKKLKERNAPKLTAEEKKLLQSLDTPIKSGLKDAPFQEAVSLLSTAIDQRIYVDTKSLEALGVNLEDKVDVPGGVTARSALRVMLQSKGLTFVLRDNIIQVVTVDMAKKQCVTRAYDVRDLVGGGFPTPGPWGPYLDAQATAQNAQIIIDAIKKSVEPAAWESSGGVGSITFHYGTMSLIVRAPSEVHADLYRKITK
jgi:hypothetical protein